MTKSPANEREATLGEYRFLCIRALGCTTYDTHAKACHRANDVARNEHYVGELEASIADTLPPLTTVLCEVCGEPVDDGDEPGRAQFGGRWVDVCSVACTQAVYDTEVQHAGSLSLCESGRCSLHPAYDVDYCPVCKPSILIGGSR